MLCLPNIYLLKVVLYYVATCIRFILIHAPLKSNNECIEFCNRYDYFELILLCGKCQLNAGII